MVKSAIRGCGTHGAQLQSVGTIEHEIDTKLEPKISEAGTKWSKMGLECLMNYS